MDINNNKIKNFTKAILDFCLSVNFLQNKETKYLKIYALISLIFALLCFVIFLLLFFDAYSSFQELSTLFYLFLPFILIFGVWIIGCYTNKKHPKLTKIFANILNIHLFIVHIILVIFLFISLLFYDPEYTNIRDYQKALRKFDANAIFYFPKEIPQNAKNIKFLKTSSSFTGDCAMYLQFDTTKEYVEKEELKYKNIGKEILIRKDKKNLDNYKSLSTGNITFDYEDLIGYKIRVLEDKPNYRAIATKENKIIYILWLN